MLLSKEEIVKIINKEPKKFKNKLTNQIINEYLYDNWEMLAMVQTMIKDIKGIDVGEIQSPRGEMCPSFIQLAISKGVHPMNVMQKASDFHALEFAFEQSMKYFRNKFNNNEN